MFKSRFQLSLFLFLAPFAPLLTAIYLLEEPSGLSLLWFSLASLGEFLLSLLLIRFHVQGKLSRRKLLQGEYLLRTVIGLPITIYYTIAAPYGFTALLRLVPALILVGRGAMISFIVQHALFYLAGVLLFSAFQARGWPAAAHVMTGLTIALTAALLARQLTGNHVLHLKVARRKLEASRLTRRLKHVRGRLRELASGLLPAFERDSFLEERRIAPRAGIYVLMVLDFPGLHESLFDFQTAAEHASEKAGLEDFAREWNRTRALLARELGALGFQAGSAAEPVVFGRLVAEQGSQAGKIAGAEPVSREEQYRGLLDKTLEAERDNLFQLIFKLGELLELAERTRRALEARGRRPWSMRAAIHMGRAAGQIAGDGNPTWTFRGPAMAELEERPDENGRIWIHEKTAGAILPAYQQGKLLRRGDWISPGLLKEELSRDGRGLEPLPDFQERMKYSGG